MSRIDTILDLDDSASLLPAVELAILGFPATNLQGLYLFEDGIVGSNPTSALDSSGNGRNASLVANSTVTRIAEGVKTGDALNNGFLFQTPIACSGSYTIAGVSRAREPLSTAGSFPVIHTGSGFYSASSGVGSALNANQATIGSLLVNNDCTGAADNANIGLFNAQAGGSTAWSGAPSNRAATSNVSPRQTWTAWALSVDAATGVITLSANGSTVTFTTPTAGGSALATWLAGAGNHAFGRARFVTSTTALGDLGLMAIYSGSSTAARLATMIAAAKARMALRGVSAA